MFTHDETLYLLSALSHYKEIEHRHYQNCANHAVAQKKEHSVQFFDKLVMDMDKLNRSICSKLYGLKDQIKARREEV